MPTVTMPIDDVYNSVVRPISVMLSKDVMSICGIDVNQVPLYLPGERGVVSQPGTNLGQDDEIRYQSHDQVICNVEERVRENQILATPARTRNDYMPILLDADLGLIIQPIYVQHDLSFNFTYISDSKQKATNWRNEFTLRVAESQHAIQHTLLYDLTINEDILYLLTEIYNKREDIAGYGQTFSEWFKTIQVKEVIAKGTLDGDLDKLTLQVSERQAHLVGAFEGGGPPEEQRNGEDITYSVEFVYKISYMKPVHWRVQYPLVIHQQHIGVDFFDPEPKVSIDDLDVSSSASAFQAFERISWSSRGRSNSIGGLIYPYHDDWYVPEDKLPWSSPLVTWLMGVSPDEPTILLDLKDLPDMEFTPNTLAYLKALRSELTKHNHSLLRFTLYENNEPLGPNVIYVDEDLVIKTRKPLDLRKVYHLRLSIVTSSIRLAVNVLEDALEYPYAVLEMYQSLLPSLDVEWALNNVIEEGALHRGYLDKLLSSLHNLGYGANGYPVEMLESAGVLPTVAEHWGRPNIFAPITIPGDEGHVAELSPTEVGYVETVEHEFEWDTEEAYEERKKEIHQRQLDEMDGVDTSVPFPIVNNRKSFRDVQFLGIFIRKGV